MSVEAQRGNGARQIRHGRVRGTDDARGAYFPDDPRQADVWSFEGQDTASVLGVLESDDRFRVFVADGEDAEQVMRTVRRSQKAIQD